MTKRGLLWVAGAISVAVCLCSCAEKEDGAASAPETPAAAASATAAATAVPTLLPAKPSGAAPGPPLPTMPSAEASADPLGALSLPDMRTCLTKCNDDNRMRAVSPEQIEADCRTKCNKTCLAHCEQASEPQKSRCRQDCEQQSGGTRFP